MPDSHFVLLVAVQKVAENRGALVQITAVLQEKVAAAAASSGQGPPLRVQG